MSNPTDTDVDSAGASPSGGPVPRPTRDRRDLADVDSAGASPRIYLITPCRNAAATIADTLTAVVDQLDHVAAHLIIDGQSTDDTLAIVERFRAERPGYGGRLVVSSRADGGVYPAMNRGIDMALEHAADHDLIGIINADDYYLPTTLSRVARASVAHPEADIFYGDGIEVDLAGTPTGAVRPSADPLTCGALMRDMCVLHPSVFVRARTYRALGTFDPAYRIAADYDFLTRAICAGSASHHLGGDLVAHRVGGLSHAARRESLAEARAVRVAHGANPLAEYVRQSVGQLRYHAYRAIRPALTPLIGAPGSRRGRVRP